MSETPNIAFTTENNTPSSISPTIAASPAEPQPHVLQPAPLDENKPNPIAKQKRSRSTDLSTEKTVKLLRKVIESSVHIVAHISKSDLFDAAADALNASTDFSMQVDGKMVHDCYERIQKALNNKDRSDAMVSKVGGSVTEADE